MTDECKLVISQFSKVPLKELSISLAVVNCDDYNDHRKFLKKNTVGTSLSLLSDPTKKYMDFVKARQIST